MPTPRYDEQQVGLRPAGTNYSNVNTRGSYGEGLGAQLAQGGEMLAQMAQKEREQSQAADLAAAEAELKDRIALQLTDKQAGYLTTVKGKAALGASETYFEAIQKDRDRIAARLPAGRVRDLFLTRSKSDLTHARSQIDVHASREEDGYRTQAFEDLWQKSVSAIPTTGGEEGVALTQSALTDQYQQMRGHIAVEAVRRGMDAHALEERWQQAAAARVLDAYVEAEDVEGLERAFHAPLVAGGKPAAELLGERGKPYARALKTLGVDRKAEAEAARIDALVRQEGTGWLNEKAARDEWAKLKDGPVKDEALRRLNERLAAGDRQKVDDIDAHYKQAFSVYEKRGLGAIPVKTKQWLLDYAPEKWHTLRKMAEDDAESARVRRERGQRESKPTKTQENAFGAFVWDLGLNRSKYTSMPFADFAEQVMRHLHESDRDKALGMVYGAMNAEARPDNRGLDPTTVAFMVNELQRSGHFPRKDPKEWNDTDQNLLYTLQGEVSDLVRRLRKDNKGEVPDDAEKRIADFIAKRLAPVAVKRRIAGIPLGTTEKPALRLTEEDEVVPQTKVENGQGLPENETLAVINALLAKGFSPTPEAISYYVRKKLGKLAPGEQPPKLRPADRGTAGRTQR